MKDWLKLKKYVHFSPKLELKDSVFIRKYVSTPEKVIKHRFFPFIHYTIKENKFKRLPGENGQKPPFRSVKSKSREILYANHLDAQIFSYYGHLLSERLEKIYQNNPVLNESIIAYRQIPFNETRNKCNIDFAREVFEFIKESSHQNMTVFCLDIKSFFDNIDHSILKKQWCKVIEERTLPLDHYKVFKAITKYTFVEISDLINEFSELNIKKIIYLKKRNIPAFCKNSSEFRERVKNKGLINYNKYDYKKGTLKIAGIPQGSPISALLSNLYLLEFDKMLAAKATLLGGLYRRYSDDILFICPDENAQLIEEEASKFIVEKLNLTIQKEKTQKITFSKNLDTKKIECCTYENGFVKNTPLSYLGFDFNGEKVLIRQKGLSSYYRKMRRMIRRRARYAMYANKHNKYNPDNPKDDWIYRQRIYKSKSHLGAKKKKIDNKVYWGNYISYITTAARIMNEPNLKNQIRKHWRIIEAQINFFETIYVLPKTPSYRNKANKD